jgi:hypothetical protein
MRIGASLLFLTPLALVANQREEAAPAEHHMTPDLCTSMMIEVTL